MAESSRDGSSAESNNGSEPTMYLQRPSSARSQDVSHVLAHTFRDVFLRDAVGADVVHYLAKSKGGDDSYHEKYVQALQNVQKERARRLAEAAMLERHIMQAQARAMSADERQLTRLSSGVNKFPDLGLPPQRAHFRSCIDTILLRKHGLICPNDFATAEDPPVPPPQEPEIPNYARETVSSVKHKQDELAALMSGTQDAVLSGSHDSLESLETMQGIQKQATCLSTVHPWQDEPKAGEREINRTDLAHLQAKVDFLKNPRHQAPSATPRAKTLIKASKRPPKEIGIKPKPEKKITPEPSVIFIPSPSVVKFSNYSVGQVYELTLELKNITTVLRPVRIVPPKTTYFSVGLGQFPGEQGLVAPGMSCHYTIRFAPDSQADYDDELLVHTQSREPIVIQLQGRRPPPRLTLPSHIDVGQCLIGGCKVAQVTVGNMGGPGRFCLMNRSSWPATNFKSVMTLASVELGNVFEVRPGVLELGSGESQVIDILFTPSETETYTQNLSIVCDNCHVKHFTLMGEGQTAGCELVAMEGGTSQPVPGEICDVSAQHLIRFDNLNPYTYYQRNVTVKNVANVEVPFSWVVVKPDLRAPDPAPDSGQVESLAQDRIQDVDSPFSVEPQVGVLPANAQAQFTITFAPPEVAEFHNVLHLVLRDIPIATTLVEQAAVVVESETGINRTKSSIKPERSVQDLTALELELKGQCEPFSVILQPYALHIPGEVLINTAIKRPFRMVNLSVSSVVFEWEKCASPAIVEVEPPCGELGPQGELDCELTVSGSVPGRVEHTLKCHVHHLDEPLLLHVQADIKGPEVCIDDGDVNFGLIKLGESVETELTIRNTCQVPARWTLRESHTHIISKEEPEFIFCPPRGELRPLEQLTVRVVFTPSTVRSIRTILQLEVTDGNETSVSVRGECQSAAACLLSCLLHIEEVFGDVPVFQDVHILNQTLLPTTFEWGEQTGEHSNMCSIRMEPNMGQLEPREQCTVQLQFTAHREGEFTDVKLPCYIAGMEKPLILSVCSHVKGLSVTYKTPMEGEEDDPVVKSLKTECEISVDEKRQELAQDIYEKYLRADSLQDEFSVVRSELEQSHAEVKTELERTREELGSKLQHANSEVERLSSIVRESEQGLGSASSQIHDLTSAADKLRAELSLVQSELRTSQSKAGTLELQELL